MADLASIGIDVDASKIKTAKQELEQLGSAFNSAERSAGVFTQAFDKAFKTAQRDIEYMRKSASAFQEVVSKATSLQQAYKSASNSADVFVEQLRKQEAQASKTAAANQEIVNSLLGISGKSASSSGAGFSALDAEMTRLESKFNSVKTASMLYAKEVADLNAAQANGIAITGGYDAALEKLNLEYQQFQNNQAGLGNRFAEGIQAQTKGLNRMGMAYQQLGYQAGDFLVQVQSGTNWMVAFGQQATQAVAVLPMFASTLGVSATALLGVATGLGVVIPLITALGAAWMRTHEEGKKAKDGLADYEKALQSFAEANKNSSEKLTGLKLNLDDTTLITIEYQKQQLIKERDLVATQQLVAEDSVRVELNSKIVDFNNQITQLVVEQAKRKDILRQVEEASLENKQRESDYENDLLIAKSLYGEQSVRVANLEREHFIASLAIKQKQLNLSQSLVDKEIELYDKTVAAKNISQAINVVYEVGKGIWETIKDNADEFNVKLIRSNSLSDSLKDAWARVATNIWGAKDAVAAYNAESYARAYSGQGVGAGRGTDASGLAEWRRRTTEQSGGETLAAPGSDMYKRIDDILNPKKSSGGSGRKGPSEDTIESRLKKLYEYLSEVDKYQVEAENIAYSQREDTLKSALEKKLITLKEYNDLEFELKRQHEEDLSSLRSEADAQSIKAQQELFKVYEDLANASSGAQLGAWGNFFGSMANLAQSGNERILKIQKAFVAAQALMDAWGAYNKVLNSPGLPWWARIPAAANVLAAGLGAVSAIKGISASGGTTSASSATSTVSSTASQAAPQTVYLSGLDPNAFYSGEQLQNLFDAFYDENDKRGKVFVVART